MGDLCGRELRLVKVTLTIYWMGESVGDISGAAERNPGWIHIMSDARSSCGSTRTGSGSVLFFRGGG